MRDQHNFSVGARGMLFCLVRPPLGLFPPCPLVPSRPAFHSHFSSFSHNCAFALETDPWLDEELQATSRGGRFNLHAESFTPPPCFFPQCVKTFDYW